MGLSVVNVIVLLGLIFQYIKITEATGTLQLKLVSYKNPEHTTKDRKCCTEGLSYCRKECANQFFICISSVTSSESCDVAKTDLKMEFGDDETFDTGDSELRFKNPLTYKFQKWQDDFEIVIRVKTKQKQRDIAYFKESVSLIAQETTSVWKDLDTFKVGRRGQEKYLKVNIRSMCDDGYGGSDCTTRTCVPRDDEIGHYTCDNKSEKVCLSGWMGDSCNIQKCIPRNDHNGHYSCNTSHHRVCMSGWIDLTNNCTVKKCVPRNDDEGHYKCNELNGKVCLPGWLNISNNCTTKLCVARNDAKAHYMCDSNHEKVCLTGWLNVSSNCTVMKCTPRNNEEGHYRCNANNTKVCLSGWLDLSVNCTIKKCVPRNDTNAHYSCTANNTKLCLPGWMYLSTNCTKENKTQTTTLPTTKSSVSTYSITKLTSSSLSPTIYNTKATPSIQAQHTSIQTSSTTTILTTTSIVETVSSTIRSIDQLETFTTVTVPTVTTSKLIKVYSSKSKFILTTPSKTNTEVIKTGEPTTGRPITGVHTTDEPSGTEKLTTGERSPLTPTSFPSKTGINDKQTDRTSIIVGVTIGVMVVAWILVLTLVRKRCKLKLKIHAQLRLERVENYVLPPQDSMKETTIVGPMPSQDSMEINIVGPVLTPVC